MDVEKKTYRVRIRYSMEHIEHVEASSAEEAEKMACEDWRSGECPDPGDEFVEQEDLSVFDE